MFRRSVAFIACAAIAAVLLGAAGSGRAAARSPHRITPVPSLDPAATKTLFHRLAQGHDRLAGTAAVACRPLRVILYAQTDWRRLATKLAANASPCAQYYISVPPLTNSKTQERSDEAWRIRALGSNFHALAEIHRASWSTWVTGGNGTWYQAGVEARKNMAAAGFDVSQGDTWAVNEFGSGVRQGTGTARADMRDFVHGLFAGDGTLPTAKGVVWTAGMGQGTTDMSVYKPNLESWLQDTSFWADMSAYVSDWSQEAYGDFRNYGVPGSALRTRRDELNDYLQHELVLANAGPSSVATARSYLRAAYTPLANAAWAFTTGYGWTSIPSDQMQNYVSAQVYALRSFSAAQAQSQDRWGFAWAPTNSLGLSSSDFTSQTGAILDRLAAAIHDSAQPVAPGDPGFGACGPAGQNLWCNGQIAGATFNDAWRAFQVWGPVPGAPIGLRAYAGPKSVQLSWAAPSISGTSAITGYRIYRSASSAGPWAAVGAIGGTTTAYKDTAVAGGTAYYYRVTAVNSGGEGAASNVAGPVWPT
jgi:hypothetical protein